MKVFTDAVLNGIAQRNWYTSLALALALPDICGFLEAPNKGSERRYVDWCESYLVPRYAREIGPARTKQVFLPGEDCYALRCAFLHEGTDVVLRQRAKKALDSFQFVEPSPGWTIHCNQFGGKLQLQVDIFCQDICSGVDEWVRNILNTQPDVQVRQQELLVIQSVKGGFSF